MPQTITQEQRVIEELLKKADITINGNKPWDITVHNDNFYRRLIQKGEVGAGESYMDGEWDCHNIDQMMTKLIEARVAEKIRQDSQLARQLFKVKIFSYGKKSKAFEIAEAHYNLGNDLFKAMLDKRLVYTCGYWKNAKTLDDAQEAKLDLVCKKVGLKPGMKVLDIGGGWGSFAKFAAEKYGVKVVNITVSKEQVELANELCKGLPVENRLQDYRDVIEKEKFDAIVSLGMFEHVNQPNYRTYMEVVRKNLKDDGLFLLHTIGANTPGSGGGGWINKYIFPNSMLPTVKQIAESSEGLFVMEDWHNFGAYYDKTLMAWHANFEKHWPELKQNYSEKFYRMWRLYLLTCAGAFRSRNIQLWQIVLSKHGVSGGYDSLR